jgi:butyryl-CoA dehydrogenase
MAGQLQEALDRLVKVTTFLHAHPDTEVRLANASVYLEAAGHIVVAWLWLDQVLATGSREDALAKGKHAACRYFFRFELPKVGPQLDLLASLDRTSLDTDPGWL